MEVRTLESAEELDSFVAHQPRSQFLQSWQWGEFQKVSGNDMMRLGVTNKGKLVASALVITHHLPLGQRYWYCPRGPIVDITLSADQYVAAGTLLIGEIKKRASESKVLFVKVEPPIELSNKAVFDALLFGFTKQPVHFVQPQDTLYVDVGKSSDDLLAAMHPKTRYNIRLAEKKGVIVRVSESPAAIEDFWRINTETTTRDQFKSHSKKYYQQLLATLTPTDQYKVFLAERNGKVLAANLVSQFGDTVTYEHGASSDTDRHVMAPHLLQWKQIEFAKNHGAHFYDFRGVGSARAKTEQRWAGISRFKKGFGGQEISFVGAYDLIIRPGWYRLYTIIKRMR